MGSLASAMQEQGNHTEAQRIFENLLELRKGVWVYQTHTLIAFRRLVTVFYKLGKIVEAEEILRQLLQVRSASGLEHPITLQTMLHLIILDIWANLPTGTGYESESAR